MKKNITTSILAILLTVLMLSLTGCTTNMSLTYNVATGDNITVKLDTTNGYTIESESSQFMIKKDDEIISSGMFITLDGYDQYIDAANNTSGVEILEKNTKNGIEYTFYSYNNSQFNYIVKIKNSNTGVLIGNAQSKESAEECFKLLTFKKN